MNLCVSLKATNAPAAPNSPLLKYSASVSTDCLFRLFNIPSSDFFFMLILLCVLSPMLSLEIYRILLGSDQSSCDPPLSSGELRGGWTQVSSLGWCVHHWMMNVRSEENTITAASTCSHRKLTMQQKCVECPARDFYRGGHSSAAECDIEVMDVH